MSTRIRIPFREASRLVVNYSRSKIVEQVPSVLFICLYLVGFQTLVLGIPVSDALIVAGGIALVVLGLALFLEGLTLGLMPLGETIGLKLPKKVGLAVVLIFAFLLGVGATFAEPAILALKAAGVSVKAWEAPLLFLLLNKYSFLLVITIGLGVGFAVAIGVLKFYFNWGLKPLIFIFMGLALAVSIAAMFEPNLASLLGLAWDSGGITTGPVTVPLIVALGIGISRIVGKNNSALDGFGPVTLASAIPIITVVAVGFALLGSVPKAMGETDFVKTENRALSASLFADDNDFKAYMTARSGADTRLALFDDDAAAQLAWYQELDSNRELQSKYFGGEHSGFRHWLINRGNVEEKLAFFGSETGVEQAERDLAGKALHAESFGQTMGRLSLGAVQSVLPLCLFLLLTLFLVAREKLPRPDEIFFGIGIAFVGMLLLNAGIEFGLSKLGNGVGAGLPATIKAIELPDEAHEIPNFDPSIVEHAIDEQGNSRDFFYLTRHGRTQEMPYDPANFDAESRSYRIVPERGPLLGPDSGVGGMIVLLLFAFVMGYAATMAEPALQALGKTVEEITVGIFKRKRLMFAVSVGVGIGMMAGVFKIVYDIPIIWLLLPAYAVLFVLTIFSTESYTCIGWDAAGVTTGPVTVPLVLAMGLGLGNQLGVVEGFGVLAMASTYPIMAVLVMGLIVKRGEKAAMGASGNSRVVIADSGKETA